MSARDGLRKLHKWDLGPKDTMSKVKIVIDLINQNCIAVKYIKLDADSTRKKIVNMTKMVSNE